MSDMVEAVAKALYEHDASLSSVRWVLWPDNRAPRSLRQKRDKYLAKARAAIEAIREPSDGQYKAALEFGLSHMARHGVDGLSPFKDYPPLRETTEGMYRAMIDAALGEAAK